VCSCPMTDSWLHGKVILPRVEVTPTVSSGVRRCEIVADYVVLATGSATRSRRKTDAVTHPAHDAIDN